MLNRYQSQIALAEFGAKGQEKLKRARVLCIGLGGLGSPCLLYLAAAGVGQLGIADSDVVELSNLQRQILYTSKQEGLRKTDCAQAQLQSLNPDCKIVSYPYRVTAENIQQLIQDYDIVIDASDNFRTRFLINDAAVMFGKPVVYGAVQGFEGQASIFWAQRGPCYRCLFPHPPKSPIMNCSDAGVLGPVAGAVGIVQALETIKLILDDNDKDPSLEPLLGKLWIFDARTLKTSVVHIPKQKACPACAHPKDAPALSQNNQAVEVEANNITADVILIDIREAQERKQGHIQNSLHIPLTKLIKNYELDPQVNYVIYCEHGERSLYAVELLQSNGISNVQSLRGGFVAWQKKHIQTIG